MEEGGTEGCRREARKDEGMERRISMYGGTVRLVSGHLRGDSERTPVWRLRAIHLYGHLCDVWRCSEISERYPTCMMYGGTVSGHQESVIGVDGNTGQERSGQKRSGQERLGQERLGQERLGQERLGQERLGQERLGQERLGQERLGQERSGQERLGQERLGQERLGQERSGQKQGAAVGEPWRESRGGGGREREM
jgi:hypothetical protein